MPTKGGRVTEDELRKEAEKEYKKKRNTLCRQKRRKENAGDNDAAEALQAELDSLTKEDFIESYMAEDLARIVYENKLERLRKKKERRKKAKKDDEAQAVQEEIDALKKQNQQPPLPTNLGNEPPPIGMLARNQTPMTLPPGMAFPSSLPLDAAPAFAPMSLATPPMALPPGMANATPAQIAKFRRTMLFLQATRTCEMAVEEVTRPRDT